MAVSNARHSFSTNLAIDPNGGSSYVTVAEVIDMDGPSMKITVTERTNLNSPNAAKEKICGFIDQGQLKVKLNFTETQYIALFGMLRKNLMSIKITYPLTGTQTIAATLGGAGQLAELGTTVPDDDRITCDVTFEASGLWTFTPGTPQI